MRELLDERPPLVFGSFINIADSAVVEIAALAGYDFVVCEGEHGYLGLETIANHARAAHNRSIGVLVRTPGNDPGYIQRALDAGVDGVLVPRVRNADEARAAVAAVRFPPEGHRGMFAKGIVAEFGAGYDSAAELVAAVGSQAVCAIIIEDAEGVANIDAIVDVPGLDIVGLGPNDLSGSMGLTDRGNDPAIFEAIDRVLTACRRAGIPAQCSMSHAPRTLEELQTKGVWMLTSLADFGALFNGMRADVEASPRGRS
jgi:4-hydroxy-2-oxoheptanedioate aldolase